MSQGASAVVLAPAKKKYTLEVKANLGGHINVPMAAIQLLMEELLALVSVALGSFTLQLTAQTKGSGAHSQQRVRIRTIPGFEHVNQGIKITVQPDGNDTCMEGTLFLPHTCLGQATFTIFSQQLEAAAKSGKPQFTEEHLREHVLTLEQHYQAEKAAADKHAHAYAELEEERAMHVEELDRLRVKVAEAERQIAEVVAKMPAVEIEREESQRRAQQSESELQEMQKQLVGLEEARLQRAMAVVNELVPADTNARRELLRRLQASRE